MHLQIDVMDKKTEEIELPPLDKKDFVWQIRTFETFMVVMTQNQVILKSPTEWHIVSGAAGMMDCVQLAPPHIAFSHISGDVMLMNRETMAIDAAYLPELAVVGRKFGADSHMMLVKDNYLYIGRPEGLIDSIPV